MGIDVENNYEPHYISIRGKGDVIKSLKSAAKKHKRFISQVTRIEKGKQLHGILLILLGLDLNDKNRVVLTKSQRMQLKQPSKSHERSMLI